MQPIEFSLVLSSVPVVLKSGDGPPQTYELREMTAALRDQYMDLLGDRVRLVDGKPVGIKKYEGMQTDLLSRCLFKEDGKPVTKEEIRAWPAAVVSSLFASAQELSHLNRVDAGKVEVEVEDDIKKD